eukprot:SAG11_NODE_2313_length_3534_cov_5.955167_3_plen_115_part_00
MQVPVNSYGKVPPYHSTTVGKFYRISAPRADIRGSDISQQGTSSSLVLEVVVVVPSTPPELRTMEDAFSIVRSSCGAPVRPISSICLATKVKTDLCRKFFDCLTGCLAAFVHVG